MLCLSQIRKFFFVIFVCIVFLVCNGQTEVKATQDKITQNHIKLRPVQSDSPVISKLRNELKNKQFTLKLTNPSNKLSFINCEKQEQITFDHVVTFFARRSFPEKGGNFYPDFNFYVLEFDNELLAKEMFEKLQKMKSGFSSEPSNFKECAAEVFGKAPYTFVRTGKQIFYFDTRAEAFRGYINQYAHIVNSQE